MVQIGSIVNNLIPGEPVVINKILQLGAKYAITYTVINSQKSSTKVINADQIAKDLGSARSANMVILGAAAPFLKMEYSEIEDAVRTIFSRKGEAVVNTNLACLKAGYEFAQKNK